MAVAYFSQGGGGGSAANALGPFSSKNMVALYRCNEEAGDRLHDATGTFAPIILANGIGIVNTSAHVNDMVFNDLLQGVVAEHVFAYDLLTPAATGGSVTHELICGHGTATGTQGAVRVYLGENATYGGGGRFGVVVSTNTNEVGLITAVLDYNVFPGLEPGTAYQLYGKFYSVGVVPYVDFYWRKAGAVAWEFLKVVTTAALGTYTLKSSGATSYTILKRGVTTTEPYLGTVTTLLMAAGASVTAEDAREALQTPHPPYVRGLLGTVARYWHFAAGAGTSANEFVTDTEPTISGTFTWAVNLAGVEQHILNQGVPAVGCPGVRLGGEASFTALGDGGSSADNGNTMLGSDDGWTLAFMMRMGNRNPAALTRVLGLVRKSRAGTIEADATLAHGLHVLISTDGGVTARLKSISKTDAATSITLSPIMSSSRATNGLLTTVVISCSSVGRLHIRTVAAGDSAVTLTYTGTGDTAANKFVNATGVVLGKAGFDSDVILGSIGVYNGEFTDAEVSLWHRTSLGEMEGTPIWVDSAASLYGNGSCLRPYKTLAAALRTQQIGQVVNLAAGSYTNIKTQDSTNGPASRTRVSYIGTGAVTLFGNPAASGDNPVLINEGSWAFYGVTFDAKSSVTGLKYHSAAASFVVGCDSVYLEDCVFTGGKKPVDTDGTGLIFKGYSLTIVDCESYGNDEHGAYLRIWDSSPREKPYTLVVDGFYVHDNLEEGLKFSNEFSNGSTVSDPTPTKDPLWWDVVISGLHSVGNKGPLFLDGVGSGVVANCLIDQNEHNLANTAGILLGGAADYMVTSNLLIANVTIRGYGSLTNQGYAVYAKNAANITMRNIVTAGCYRDFYDPGDAIDASHCSGDCGIGGYEWPVGNNNEPAADLVFVGAGPGLAAAHLATGSDGIGTGLNLWDTCELARTDMAGVARDAVTAWNRGAF